MNLSLQTLAIDTLIPVLRSLSNVLDKGVCPRKQAESSGA
jgi:hypothetical protein